MASEYILRKIRSAEMKEYIHVAKLLFVDL